MKRTIALTVALGLGLTACGASTHHSAVAALAPTTTVHPTRTVPPTTIPPTTTTTVTVDYQAQYLRDVAPANAATNQVNAAADPTAAQLTALGDSYTTLGRNLLRQTWPASARADAHTLAVSLFKCVADLGTPPTVAGLNSASNDEDTSNADANALRADLGLPSTT